MGEIRQSSKFLKRCIEDTLFIMLEKKTYKEIDVKELCDKACVGRTSFYRYFKDLDDVILFSFIRMWEEWCDTHRVKIRNKFSLDNAVTFFEHNYESRFYGYGLFSMLKEWWLRNFKETPNEMANIIIKIVKNGNN